MLYSYIISNFFFLLKMSVLNSWFCSHEHQIMIVTVVAATDVSRCMITMLHFGTLFILTQDGSRALSTPTVQGSQGQVQEQHSCFSTGIQGHTTQLAYVVVWSCAVLAAFALALLSQHDTTCLFDIHPTVYQGPSTPCIFPSKLEHLAVELYSSTFLNTQTVKT